MDRIRRELKNSIPNFLGYENREYRVTSDRALKEYVAEEIHKILDKVRRLTIFAPGTVTSDRRMIIEHLLYFADKLRKEVLKEGGYIDEFGRKEINIKKLNKLIEFDYKIIQMTKKLSEMVGKIENFGILHPEIIHYFKMVIEGLNVLKQRFMDREKYIVNI